MHSVCLELNLYTNSSLLIRKHTLICRSYFLPPRVQVMITLFTKQCACVSKTLLSLKLSASGKTEASFCQSLENDHRIYSVVRVRNCRMSLSSLKCVWILLARCTNSNCSIGQQVSICRLWFKSAIDTEIAPRELLNHLNNAFIHLFIMILILRESKVCVGG